MSEIAPGAPVIITDAFGQEIQTRARSGVEKGHKFPVVWVERPLKNGDTDCAPWPLEAVRPDDELTRFASLARKLIQVPKAEIDAERAKERGVGS